MTLDPVLVVDDDPFVLGVLSHAGRVRGLEVVAVQTAEEAEACLRARRFSVAVVNLRLGPVSGLELIKRVRESDASTEAIVISDDRRLSSALDSYAHDVFAFVPKPFDPSHLFATVDRALERRCDALERSRLTWELRLLNDVATTLAITPEISGVLQQGLEKVADAYAAEWAVLRLTPLDGGPLTVRASVIAPSESARASYRQHDGAWPEVAPAVETRTRALSIPVAAGVETLGVLTVSLPAPKHFGDDDQRILLTIGRQFGVAVSNGQLYERVHRAKVQWERTFDAISDPIALFDSRSRTMRTNAALAALRGWAIQDTRGRTCAEVGLCGGGCPNCLVGRAIRDGRRLDQEITTRDDRIFSVTTLPVPDASGAAVQFAKEVTEERQRGRQLRALTQEVSATNAELMETVDRLRSTQAQLVQAEKLSAIGQLVAGVAHELNNPLTSVIGFTQLVQDELLANPALAATSATVLEDVSVILSESERAARIVSNLLTFSRRQAGERGALRLTDLFARVANLRAYDSRVNSIEVIQDAVDTLPPILADAGQMQQALLNLVLNAEHAMRHATIKRLELSARADAACGAVVISVKDSGHGIPAQNLARVFDPFFTTGGVGEGTGLGLSIVYGIVRDHGGEVWATSTEGGGTTFFVRLPVRARVPRDGANPVAVVAHGETATRDFIAAALAGWGVSVRPARNGREALELLTGDLPSVVMLDAALPGLDSPLWRERLAALRGRVKIVALANGPGEAVDGAPLRDAADHTLSPPYDLPALRAALVATLGDEV